MAVWVFAREAHLIGNKRRIRGSYARAPVLDYFVTCRAVPDFQRLWDLDYWVYMDVVSSSSRNTFCFFPFVHPVKGFCSSSTCLCLHRGPKQTCSVTLNTVFKYYLRNDYRNFGIKLGPGTTTPSCRCLTLSARSLINSLVICKRKEITLLRQHKPLAMIVSGCCSRYLKMTH